MGIDREREYLDMSKRRFGEYQKRVMKLGSSYPHPGTQILRSHSPPNHYEQ